MGMGLLDALPRACGVGFLCVALCGCGAGRGTVSGKVTYQNKPLQLGSVVVVGSDGIPRTAPITAGGLYIIPDIPCGEARLAVHSPDPAGAVKIYEEEQIKLQKGLRPPPGRKPADVDRQQWFPIPPQYGDFARSGLALTVRQGTNPLDIDMK
jgi:hypothetical protein